MKIFSFIIAVLFFVAPAYSQTRSVIVGTNSAVISPTNFWSADAANARSGLGLGTAATNPSTAFQPSSSVLTNLANNNGASLTNISILNTTGTLPLSSGGTGATNAATARTNLGLGATWLTNTNVANFRGAIGLGDGNDPEFNSVNVGTVYATDIATVRLDIEGRSLEIGEDNQLTLYDGGLAFSSTTNAAITRTNLGIPWSGLTNTNAATFQTALFGAGTNPVLVNTNGSVVSPTNFWQVAPISTTVQYQTNITGTSTNAATNSRNLFLFSLSPSVSGVTNTVTLPTNPATTFDGDRATITHLAQTTNSVTAIRQLGAATNIITLNQLDEAVLLMYRGGAWMLADNISYIEPIYFSGTNASANAASSRTNLGLGTTNNVAFSNIVAGGTLTSTGVVTVVTNLNVGGAIAVTNAAATRTNLGIPLAALTNTSNTNFQAAIFATNSTPTNTANANAINFNTAVAWMGVTVVTNGVTNTFRIPLFQ